MTRFFFQRISLYFKKPKIEHRKLVHYTLLACIIFLQIIVVIIWYNEKVNETKLSKAEDEISSSNMISQYTNKVNNSIINSQEYFNNYISYKDEVSLEKYSASLQEMSSLIDSLSVVTKDNKEFEKILIKKNKTETDILDLKSSIDSIINKQITPNPYDVSKLFKFNKFEFNTILDNIKISSSTKTDSVQRRGLFSRLGNALAGKQDVQKEWSNVIVTMKYKEKITSGSIEEQIMNIFLTTSKYYENEFNNLKKSFFSLRDKDLKLIDLNNQLLYLSQNVLPNYSNSVNILQANSQKNLQDQYKSNRIVRNYTIVILILLMFIISIVLLSFTRMAFEYEKRLTTAQNQIRQSLNFKNRIMGMISHEIRSPLNIISIYNKKVSARVKDIEMKETFKSIQFTINSLLLLSNQVLEYSKDENHKPKLKNKNFYLKIEIDQIISSMISLVESKGNKIRVKSNLNSDNEIYSDAIKLHQLFYNIIGNANKFTENGLISIIINLEPISDYEVNLKVKVQDNGIGIAENDLKNIFESYYQGTVSGKVNDLGVGLGLNLCKEIIELFDGDINVVSKEDKGTEVVFNLILSQV
ncbi:sensor histidine kinase [Flavobacterium collinsii]|uniref:histidine kinase n=1 Tax=Flavobacterium collinsii TaxID=1114861 RepID=A0ABM8KM20_9FLAO|nr:HAMP domain-containing sensor histidine kinase [Flavobacterium collinsii]GIQ61029.1 histidine kinase [Flavobacterium collinsii]CAA9200436.1 Adaptive-response sensory-kinase SasA [Flavobacterium collinsii]